jgi:hypothetical protein
VAVAHARHQVRYATSELGTQQDLHNTPKERTGPAEVGDVGRHVDRAGPGRIGEVHAYPGVGLRLVHREGGPPRVVGAEGDREGVPRHAPRRGFVLLADHQPVHHPRMRVLAVHDPQAMVGRTGDRMPHHAVAEGQGTPLGQHHRQRGQERAHVDSGDLRRCAQPHARMVVAL